MEGADRRTAAAGELKGLDDGAAEEAQQERVDHI